VQNLLTGTQPAKQGLSVGVLPTKQTGPVLSCHRQARQPVCQRLRRGTKAAGQYAGARCLDTIVRLGTLTVHGEQIADIALAVTCHLTGCNRPVTNKLLTPAVRRWLTSCCEVYGHGTLTIVLASFFDWLKERNVMEKFVELEPVELNDAELAAVAGGFTVTTGNGAVSNSFNNAGNVALTNSSLTNSSITA
jgi:hypothetical protein